MDGIGRIWDLRTGRSIMILQGHVNAVTATAFSPSCYQIATGSSDNTLRIHDIRQLKSNVVVLPAHKSSISAIKILGSSSSRPEGSRFGDYMVSGGFDNEVKIWGYGDWRALNTLAGHRGKIMDLDVSEGKLGLLILLLKDFRWEHNLLCLL